MPDIGTPYQRLQPEPPEREPELPTRDHWFRWERCFGWCHETHNVLSEHHGRCGFHAEIKSREDTMCGGCCKIPERQCLWWIKTCCQSKVVRRICEAQSHCTLLWFLVFVLLMGLWLSGRLEFNDYGNVTSCSMDAGVLRDGYQVTHGDCKFFRCHWNRGPTQCINGECACPPGFCSTGQTCILAASNTAGPTNGTVSAEVFAVNVSSGGRFPGAHGDVQTALLFSGGGMRSLSLAVGQLRALHKLSVMENVDAISAVSGGAWAASIYMFSNRSVDALLNFDFPATPSNLTLEALGSSPGVLGDVSNRPMDIFFKSLTTAHASRSDMWESFVKFVILDSVGLGNRAQPMAASLADVQRIKKRNPLLQNVSFLVPARESPKVFVMGGAVLGQLRGNQTVVSLQMSPDFSGWPFHPKIEGHYDTDLGGGLVETFVLGDFAPNHSVTDPGGESYQEVPMPALPWSLSKALAVSSCAGAGQLASLSEYSEAFAPDGTLWPIPVEPDFDFSLGDGGLIDNAGLLPMLQRGAIRVVWFINTDTGISDAHDFCDASITNEPGFPKGFLTNQVTDKFGYGADSPKGYLSHNQVFDKKDMLAVVCGLQTKKKEGKPAAFSKRHMVLRNDWWGIRGGTEVEIMYMYHEYSSDFVEQLPEETQSKLNRGSTFKHYPFFKTMFQNGPTWFTQYTRKQTNLLAATAEFAVTSNADEISNLLWRRPLGYV